MPFMSAVPLAPVQLLGGGTTLRLNEPGLRTVKSNAEGLRIGALATMRQVADDATVRRDYPVLSQSLWLAAPQQIRNMAFVGGKVLQRTRCSYFRDTRWACNKCEPCSVSSALEGIRRWHAVLGNSEQCIASYPGDRATVLVALDATVETVGPRGPRSFCFAELHRVPGRTPHIETQLQPGGLVTAFNVPAGPHTRRPLYLKVRDRESCEFALAGAADMGQPIQHHNPIELFATSAHWIGEELAVHEPQFTYGQRNATVALIARRRGRPIKLVATRDQGFTISGHRNETSHRVRLAADGTARAETAVHDVGTGAYTVVGQMAADCLAITIDKLIGSNRSQEQPQPPRRLHGDAPSPEIGGHLSGRPPVIGRVADGSSSVIQCHPGSKWITSTRAPPRCRHSRCCRPSAARHPNAACRPVPKRE